jgi:hypothetical protein
MSSPSLEPIQARLSLQTPAWRQIGQNSEIWTDSPLLVLSLFSLGCGVLVCSLTLSQKQPRSWLAHLLSVIATKVARVFSFIPPKKAPQPLNANLDQRLIRVGLLKLMLSCQHTSMWRDMAQHSFGLCRSFINEVYWNSTSQSFGEKHIWFHSWFGTSWWTYWQFGVALSS